MIAQWKKKKGDLPFHRCCSKGERSTGRVDEFEGNMSVGSDKQKVGNKDRKVNHKKQPQQQRSREDRHPWAPRCPVNLVTIQ